MSEYIINGKTYRNLEAQVLENAKAFGEVENLKTDVEELKSQLPEIVQIYYSSGTYSQVYDAIYNGKIPVVRRSVERYYFYGFDEINLTADFFSVQNDVIWKVKVDTNNNWTREQVEQDNAGVEIVEYNVSTWNAVSNAISDGKYVVCKYNENFLPLSYYEDSVQCNFAGYIDYPTDSFVKVRIESDDTWYAPTSYEITTTVDIDSTNYQIPTARAVYLASQGGGGGVQELYECTYGTTTYAQITNALNNGYLPYVIYNNRWYWYSGVVSSNTHCFGTVYASSVPYIRVTSADSWQSGSATAQYTSNLVTSMSSASTNVQYPSAKCVYDAIQAVSGAQIFEATNSLGTLTLTSSVIRDLASAFADNPVYIYSTTDGVYYFVDEIRETSTDLFLVRFSRVYWTGTAVYCTYCYDSYSGSGMTITITSRELQII